MLHLVQDVHTKPAAVSTYVLMLCCLINFDVARSPPSMDIISQFVSLVTAVSAPIAPPVAILGLTYVFLNWLSTAVLENVFVSFSLC